MKSMVEEQLCRYLDGEMDTAEAAAFESEMARDPQLAALHLAWQAQDAAVANDIDDFLAASPMSEVALVPQAAPVIDLAAVRAERVEEAATRPPARRWVMSGTIAAGLAVVALMSMLQLSGGSSGLEQLETLPTGQMAMMEDGRELTAVLTFAAADGRWCREYALSGGTLGIACREDGDWQMVEEVAGAAPATPSKDGFATASGSDGAALDAVYAGLEAGDALDAAEEQRLMARGWTQGPK